MNQIDPNTAYEIAKTFSVTKDQLFAALIDSAVLKKIWGVQSITVDARVNGKAQATYIEEGQDWSFTITYKEIIPNEKLRWITHFKSFPSKETRVTLLFKKLEESKTNLLVRMENFDNAEERDANKKAWEKGLEILEETVK